MFHFFSVFVLGSLGVSAGVSLGIWISVALGSGDRHGVSLVMWLSVAWPGADFPLCIAVHSSSWG